MDSSECDEGSNTGGKKESNGSESPHVLVNDSDRSSNVGTSHQDCELQGCGEMHPAVSSGDFGQVVWRKAQRNITDSERFYLLKHHFVPRKGYKFPSHTFSGQQRLFQNSWLDRYSGLGNSESKDGGYCKFACCLQPMNPQLESFVGVLVTQPLTIIFKTCIQCGIIPDIWKVSQVILIHQKNDKGFLNN